MPRDFVESPRDLAWQSIIFLVLGHLTVQATGQHGGWFRDELYYIACARRLSWSYVDHPALSVALLRVLLLFTESLSVIRSISVACGAATLVGVLVLARMYGATPRFQLVAGLAILSSPVFAGIHSFYSMNALEPLFWITIGLLSTASLVAFCPNRAIRMWSLIACISAIGFHNKLSILWILIPLCTATAWLARRSRVVPLKAPILVLVVVALGAVPWVLWQSTHGFPTVEFLTQATRLKMQPTSPWQFLSQQLLTAGPLLVSLSAYGMFSGLRYRLGNAGYVLAAVVLFNILLLSFSPAARAYYLMPAHCLGAALGAAAFSRSRLLATLSRARFAALIAGLLLPQTLGLPLALPLLPPATTVKYLRLLPMGVPQEERSRQTALPQHLADRHGWEELANFVRSAWMELPTDSKGRIVIITANYGQAAALEFFLGKHADMSVASVHNHYWFWAKPEEWGSVFLLLGFRAEEVSRYFARVEFRGEFRCEWCREDGALLLLAQDPRSSPAELWPLLKKFL